LVAIKSKGPDWTAKIGRITQDRGKRILVLAWGYHLTFPALCCRQSGNG